MRDNGAHAQCKSGGEADRVSTEASDPLINKSRLFRLSNGSLPSFVCVYMYILTLTLNDYKNLFTNRLGDANSNVNPGTTYFVYS